MAGLTRRELRKKLTRETLLAVALDIISRQSIYVTTIEDVTQRANIGKGTFYQYFSSKEDLLEQLLKEGLSKLIVCCRSSLNQTKGSGAALKKLAKVHSEFLIKNGHYLLLFHQVRGYLQLRHPVSANLRKVYSHYLLELAGILSPFFGGTERSDYKAKEAALSLAAYSTGLTTHYRLFHRLLDLPFEEKIIERKIAAALL